MRKYARPALPKANDRAQRRLAIAGQQGDAVVQVAVVLAEEDLLVADLEHWNRPARAPASIRTTLLPR